MKCTIEKIINVPLQNNRFGSRIEGFLNVPNLETTIPEQILRWIKNYEGVKAIVYDNGIFIASWAETTCSEKDKFDETKGSHLAESKAKVKVYRFIRNFTTKMSNYFDSIANTYEDAFLKYYHCVTHEEEHFNTLGNENN